MLGAREAIDAIIRDASTWRWSTFDLAAVCYVELKKRIQSEELFLAVYDSHVGSKGNPNLTLLDDLAFRFASRFDELYEEGRSSYEAYEEMREACVGIELTSFGDDAGSEATLLWAIIKAVDRSCGLNWWLDTEDWYAPLNEKTCNMGIGVYYASQMRRGARTLFSIFNTCTDSTDEGQSESPKSKMPHPERIPELRLNGCLCNLLFLEKGDAMALPSLVSLPCETNEIQESNSTLRVGLELFSGGKLADWKPTDSPIRLVETAGAAFEITYSEEYASLFSSLVCQSIERAVAEECDILVFPEIVISVELLEIIRNHLNGLRDRGRLKLVVAGSAWVLEPESHGGNNICTILDSFGTKPEVGRTYKQIPVLFNRKHEIDDTKIQYVEALTKPAAERTVVDIRGIGRMVTAICKDLVADDREPLDLARDMNADIVVVPAMSDSIDRGFASHFELMAERCLAACFLCNLCCMCKSHHQRNDNNGPNETNLLDGNETNETEVSFAYVPGARSDGNPKHAEPKRVSIMRNERGQKECVAQLKQGTPQSCLRIIEVRHGPDARGLEATEITKPGLSYCFPPPLVDNLVTPIESY